MVVRAMKMNFKPRDLRGLGPKSQQKTVDFWRELNKRFLPVPREYHFIESVKYLFLF